MRTALSVTVLSLLLASTSASADTLTFWRDCSSSMSEAELEKLVPVLRDVIEAEERIDRIETIRFSCADGRTFSQRPTTFALPSKPIQARQKRTGMISEWFLAGVEAAASETTARHIEALNTFRNKRSKAIEEFVRDVRTGPSRSAGCTRFDALAVRIVEENRPFNVMLTDGWVDCPITVTPLQEFTGRLAIVLVPRETDSPSAEVELFETRATDMRRFFPNSTVVKPYQLQREVSSFWRRATNDARPRR